MNQLTRIAALPGSGAGCSAALRAETVPAEKKESADLAMAAIHASFLVMRKYLAENPAADADFLSIVPTEEGGE